MKDIHLQINPVVELFSRGCAINQILHYYSGHSHHTRGIHLEFRVNCITTKFFNELQEHFGNFYIRYDKGYIEVVICLFEDDDLPF